MKLSINGGDVFDAEEGITPAQLRTTGLVPATDEVWLERSGNERFLTENDPIRSRVSGNARPVRLVTRPAGMSEATRNPSRQDAHHASLISARQPLTEAILRSAASVEEPI